MADRRVTKSGKDSDGDITSLCNPGQYWSPKGKSSAINEIENNTHTYYVQDSYGRRADIHVVNGVNGKYLRTDPNSSCTDNLDNIPDC
ncbi:DUF3892 domain-containing protein [Gracilimonas sp.]|uniref:DUF3892 domain-containing protein n=1 Tax=Gracilimonas sp. TaxID=1974203 RepID=UPI0032EC0001